MAKVTYLSAHRRRGLGAAAAELTEALEVVYKLLKQGHTSGAEWERADIRQQNAIRAWRLALREVAAELPALRRASTFLEIQGASDERRQGKGVEDVAKGGVGRRAGAVYRYRRADGDSVSVDAQRPGVRRSGGGSGDSGDRDSG